MNEERKRNRIISFFYIGIFISALVVLFVTGTTLITKYRYNQELLRQKEELQAELDYIKDIDANVEEGYYVVYAEGEYALDIYGEVVIIYN